MRPRISLFSLGGTIASTRTTSDSGALVTLTGEDLLQAVPSALDVADIEVHAVHQVPSGDLDLSTILALASAIDERFAKGCDAAVVTQGTDTLEETSFLLDLLVGDDRPVVLTGAMRNPSLPGADGPANLLAAVRVAASGLTGGMGATVVFNDEIHAARFVRKRHSTSTATFGSPLAGPIGHVVEDTVRVLLRPPGRTVVSLPQPPGDALVGLVPVAFDDDPRLLRQVGELSYDGLVVAAFGGGHVPASFVPPLEDLAASMPVVLASRTFAGPILRHTYSYPGGEIDLVRRGLISAGAVDAVHARILLRVLLMAGLDRPAIAATFQDVLTASGRRVIKGLRERPGSSAAAAGGQHQLEE